MSGIIGKKIGMTSVFSPQGKNLACTLIEAGPCVITQVRTQDKDGYEALQLAFDDKKDKNTAKSLLGHFKKAKTSPKKKLVEFAVFNPPIEKKEAADAENQEGQATETAEAPAENSKEKVFKLGDTVKVNVFQAGDFVDVSGVSKGKGFQGVVKRHGFAGVGQATHGQHNRLRAPGSIGAASYPARVFKGMKMAGRMGGEKVKVQNLEVVKVISEKNLILIKGAIPGPTGSYVTIQK